ncbi:hypothetical protein D3C85_1596730 [compost metagenome]
MQIGWLFGLPLLSPALPIYYLANHGLGNGLGWHGACYIAAQTTAHLDAGAPGLPGTTKYY